MQKRRIAEADLIRESLNAAWDRVIVQGAGTPWTELDLARAALEEMRTRRTSITQRLVSQLLAQLVSEGFFMRPERDGLFWIYGDVTVGDDPTFFDALDEVDVANVINRAFKED